MPKNKGCTYHHLLKLLEMVAAENDLVLLPTNKMRWPAYAPELERQAATLTRRNMKVLTQLGTFKKLDLVQRKGIAHLNTFLNEAHDGDLHQCFFKPAVVQQLGTRTLDGGLSRAYRQA